jgi:hypothetical protein
LPSSLDNDKEGKLLCEWYIETKEKKVDERLNPFTLEKLIFFVNFQYVEHM